MKQIVKYYIRQKSFSENRHFKDFTELDLEIT